MGHRTPSEKYTQLEQAGEIVESVLDVGCGTGDNALYLTEHGHEVWGVDFAPTAIQKALEKTAQRHLTATFRVLNVLELHTLGRTFDTVIDRGGTYFMLCFSELTPLPDFSELKNVMPKDSMPDLSKVEPEDYKRLQMTQAEIKESFQDGWRINYIRQATLEGRLGPSGVHAWLSSISKE